MRITVAGSEVYAYTGSRPLDGALPAVVFVHGAGNDHSVWALQSRYFAHHGWNVLAVDLPGHDRSGGEALPSVEALADWLPALLDAAGIGNAALVGHSLGSLAALECAARHPERVTRVALLGPAAPMPVSDALLDAAMRNDHVAYELITGWSYSPGKQLGGARMPGVWLTGNAMRLLERTRAGRAPRRPPRVPSVRRRGRQRGAAALPGARRSRRARHHGPAEERGGAHRGAARRARRHAARTAGTR